MKVKELKWYSVEELLPENAEGVKVVRHKLLGEDIIEDILCRFQKGDIFYYAACERYREWLLDKGWCFITAQKIDETKYFNSSLITHWAFIEF